MIVWPLRMDILRFPQRNKLKTRKMFSVVLENTAYPLLRCVLQPNETVVSESGAMVQHGLSKHAVSSLLQTALTVHRKIADVSIELKGKAQGGLKKAFARAFAGGESFFQVLFVK